MANKTPSYPGPPAARANSGVQMQEPRAHSPRMTPQQMLRQPMSAQSLQAPVPTRDATSVKASARYSVANGAPPPQANEEVLVFSPHTSFTPRLDPRLAQPPPIVGGPRRNGGSQSVNAPRQFATNLSPRMGNRESKRSIAGGDASSPHFLSASHGDKENRDNIIRDNMVDICKDGREQLVAKLQEDNAEQFAKLAEQNAKLAQKEQACEIAAVQLREAQVSSVQLREAQALHERLRMDLDEAAKRKEATDKQLQGFQELREEHRALQLRCSSFEQENMEIQQKLASFEQQHAKAERSHSLSYQETQAELSDKEIRLHAMQCEMNDKDTQFQEVERLLLAKEERVQEMDCRQREKDAELQEMMRAMREKEMEQEHNLHELQCLIHDKDQTVQQMKHEHHKTEEDYQKRDTTMQSQLHDFQNELRSLADRQSTAKRQDEKEIKVLKQKLQDQKTLTDNLESQLRRTAAAANLISPGEFQRMFTSMEAKNGFSVENAQLASRSTELETVVMLMHKEIALLRRRLPPDVCEAISCEAKACSVALGAEDERDSLTVTPSRAQVTTGEPSPW